MLLFDHDRRAVDFGGEWRQRDRAVGAWLHDSRLVAGELFPRGERHVVVDVSDQCRRVGWADFLFQPLGHERLRRRLQFVEFVAEQGGLLRFGRAQCEAARRFIRQDSRVCHARLRDCGVGDKLGLDRPVRIEDRDEHRVRRLVGQRRQVRPDRVPDVAELVTLRTPLRKQLTAVLHVSPRAHGRQVLGH